MIDTVLFDLGETLIHIDASLKPRLEELRLEDTLRFLSSRDITFDKAEFERVLDEAAQETIKLTVEQNVEATIQEIFATTLHRLDVKFNTELLGSVEKAFYQREVDSWRLFDTAEEVLSRLDEGGFKIGLVTNTRSDWMVRETVRRVGIDTFFGIIVTSAQLGVRKPRPEPFLKALTALNSDPMEGVMVGDTLSTDIRGARALSMKAIHINRRRDEREDVRPDVEVDSLNDVYSINEEWRV